MPIRVLIVDDAVFSRDRLKEVFEGAEFEVVGEATNGVEAVEKWKALKPDITTMDIYMPFKNGIEATREIVSGDPRALIVICSAIGDETKIMEALDAGATDYIVKPINPEDVRRIVRKITGADSAA